MARRRRTLHKRYRKNPDSGSSSSALLGMPVGELWGWVGPGFLAFGGARFVTYLATQQLSKRKPSWGAKGGAVAALGTFLAAWFAAHRVKFLRPYAEPIIIGSALAGMQSIIQLFVPKLGWMVGDPTAGVANSLPDPGQVSQLPPGFAPVEDPTAFEYNDAHDGGIFGAQASAADTSATPSQQQDSSAPAPDDLFADLDMPADATMGGIFS